MARRLALICVGRKPHQMGVRTWRVGAGQKVGQGRPSPGDGARTEQGHGPSMRPHGARLPTGSRPALQLPDGPTSAVARGTL